MEKVHVTQCSKAHHPPFNSNANYNVLFKEATGEASQAQFHAFTDTWEWTRDVDDTYRQFVDTCPNASVVEMVEALNASRVDQSH